MVFCVCMRYVNVEHPDVSGNVLSRAGHQQFREDVSPGKPCFHGNSRCFHNGLSQNPIHRPLVCVLAVLHFEDMEKLLFLCHIAKI